MKKKLSLGVTLLLVFLAALTTFQITYFVLAARYQSKLREAELSVSRFSKLIEVDELFRDNTVYAVDDEALIDGVLAGYAEGTGDRYCYYYDRESFQTYMDSLNGNMEGIGVNVIYNDEAGGIEIINVMPNSPALEAGLKPGDLIVYVGEEKESVVELGYYVALSKLQGKAGTTAVFTVARGKNYEELLSFSIVRGYIKEQSVMHHVYALDASVGIIRITGFDKATPEQFVSAVKALREAGCKKLVLDVRYNPGGELTAICTVLDYLLPYGPVIRTIDREGNEEIVYISDKAELDMPMAVLVNGSTASAGELFCSALQDYKKAVIVGTQTYGKGSMQTIRELSDGSGFVFTYRLYCPPYSDNYDGVGVTPDVVVELDEAIADKNFYKITDEEDNQLHAAVAALG